MTDYHYPTHQTQPARHVAPGNGAADVVLGALDLILSLAGLAGCIAWAIAIASL